VSNARVTVIGSFVVGLTLRADRFPVSGETVLATDFDKGPGGKGSNQAVQIARMGCAVEFVGVLGDDDFARIATHLYSVEGVGTRYLEQSNDTYTGAGFIILDAAGQNRILLDPGSNDRFTPEHVERARTAIEGSGVVIAQLEIPTETAVAGLRAGKEAGAISILNPAPVRPIPKDAFAAIDILTPNQSEARVLLGLEPDDPTEDADVCARLLELGVGTIVMTLGEEGAAIVTAEGRKDVAAYPIEVVDSTGAGDAFSGTMSAFLAEGMDIATAADRGTAAGALACTALGVIPALPRRDAVEKLVAKGRTG
jgi:ribokinase